MDPREFTELERLVLEAVPAMGGRGLIDVVAEVRAASDRARTPSDVKAAVLGLKARGRVTLDAHGILRRCYGQSITI